MPPCIETGIGYKDVTLNGSTTIAKHGELELKGTCVINGDMCIESGGKFDHSEGTVTVNGSMCIEYGAEVSLVNVTITGTVIFATNCNCSGCD